MSTENKEISLRGSLAENSIEKMKMRIDSDINNIIESMDESNIGEIEELSDTIALSALTPFNFEIYNSDRDLLTRHEYRFPSIINIGKLKNWHSTPSRILREKYYPSEIPFLLPFGTNSVGFFMNQKFKNEIISTMELIGIKLLASIPDGLSRVTIIDKNGAGQNFPTLLMLGDKFTDGKILSEDNQIERELLELKNIMTVVTQSITSNGFDSIEDYNRNTEEVPQPYKFIFIANFPSGFSKKAAEALIALLESGPSAGIYVIINFTSDPKYGMAQDVSGIPLSEFLKNITIFEYLTTPHDYTRRGFLKYNINLFNTPLVEDLETKKFHNNTYKIEFEIPNHKEVNSIIEDLNERIKNLNLRPVISILKTMPKSFWGGNAGKGVCAPFAKSGIENIYLSLGVNQYGEDESTHHGIIGGSTGSGKTVTLHDMILHLCMKYSPEDLNFWLLDYKEGTEFAVYKNFPYIQILSMESEVEFGQEVLDKAITLMKNRGKLFKSVGVGNLFLYNKKIAEQQSEGDFSAEKLPRIVIIIDEFQALFPKNAKVTGITNNLIDQILRLGRSFGINLLLSTQTLKGVDMDPQLLSNMPLRIALKMDEKDAVKLFGDDNAAPKYLQYPGEGIYNKSYGNSTANVPFQAYLALGPQVDDLMGILVDHMKKEWEPKRIDKLMAPRFVYNGDLKSEIVNNIDFMKIKNENKKLDNYKFYIGEPAGLNTEHSYFKFNNEYADNLLMVGMDIVKGASIFYYMVEQLFYSEKNAKIHFANFNNNYKPQFSSLVEDLSSKGMDITYVNNNNMQDSIEYFYNKMEERKLLSESDIKDLDHEFLFTFFVENSKIFNTSSFAKESPIAKLKKILAEGSEYGLHVALYATSFTTISNIDFARETEKFRKKIALRGGNSLKTFGEEGSDTEFSKSINIAIGTTGQVGEQPFKFKPYLNDLFIMEE